MCVVSWRPTATTRIRASQAAKNSNLSNHLYRKLVNLDVALSYIRHIALPHCDALYFDTVRELGSLGSVGVSSEVGAPDEHLRWRDMTDFSQRPQRTLHGSGIARRCAKVAWSASCNPCGLT